MSLNPDTGTLAASTASAHITTDNVKRVESDKSPFYRLPCFCATERKMDSEDQRFNPFSQHYHLIISIW